VRTRAGVTFAGVVLAIAVAGVVAAVLAPEWRERRMDRHIEAVVAEIDAVRARAEAAREASGDWPAEVEVGAVGAMATGTGPSPSLAWRRMTSVEVPPPPVGPVGPGNTLSSEPVAPTPARYFHQGTLSVLGADDAVVAALLTLYPRSFVHGRTWTLLLPRIEIAEP